MVMQVLGTLLEVSAYAAVLAAAILAFQKLFEKKLSAGARFALWLLLIVRLAMPVTFDSGVRVIQLEKPQAASAGEAQEAVRGESTQQAVYVDYAQEPARHLPVRESERQAAWWTQISWQGWLLIVWLAGAAISAATVLWMRGRSRRLIRCGAVETPPHVRRVFDKCRQEMQTGRHTGLSIQADLDSPALTMEAKPMVLLPRHMLDTMDEAALDFAIRHELSHLARRDHITSMVMLALRCVYWFNPAVWLAFRRMHADMELACDERVTAHLDKEEKREYVKAILDLSGGCAVQYTLGMRLSGGKIALEKRIRGIFMKRDMKRWTVIPAIALAAMLVMACFTTACQPTFVETAAAAEADQAATEEAAPEPTEAPEPQYEEAAEATSMPTPAEENAATPRNNMIVTKLTEEEIRNIVAEAIWPDGEDYGQEMYLPDLNEPLSKIDVYVGGPEDSFTWTHCVSVDPQTGDLLAIAEDVQEPEDFGIEMVTVEFTEDEVKQKAADIIRQIWGEDVSPDELYFPFVEDLSEPLASIDIQYGGSSKTANDWKYSVSLDPRTGELTWADKSFGPQVVNVDADSKLDEYNAQQDKQKIADMSVALLEKMFGAGPKAYFTDGVQAVFDENNSILTDCHVQLDDGRYYVVSVVYPGYTVGRIFSDGTPFLSDEQLESYNFDVMKIY